jgi:hypothetical protein
MCLFGLLLIQLICKRGTFFSANFCCCQSSGCFAYGLAFFLFPIQNQHVGCFRYGGFSDSQSKFDIWVFRLFRSLSLLHRFLLLLLNSLSQFLLLSDFDSFVLGFPSLQVTTNTNHVDLLSVFLALSLLSLVSVLSISIFSVSPTLTA